MDIIVILFVFIFGFIFGWLRASKSILDKLLSDPDSMVTLLTKYKDAKDDVETEDGTREIEVQKEQGTLYLYAKDDGEFLGQGNTIEEALDAVRKRFPGQNFHGHITATEAKEMGLSKQI
jgi:hypothetical protein